MSWNRTAKAGGVPWIAIQRRQEPVSRMAFQCNGALSTELAAVGEAGTGSFLECTGRSLASAGKADVKAEHYLKKFLLLY